MYITLDMVKISTPFGEFKRTYDKQFPEDDTDIEFYPRVSEWNVSLRRFALGEPWVVMCRYLTEEKLCDCMSAFAQLKLALDNYGQQLRDDKAQEDQYAARKDQHLSA